MFDFAAIQEWVSKNFSTIFLVLFVLFRVWTVRKSLQGGDTAELPGNKVVTVTNMQEWNERQEEAKKNKKLLIVDFFATWCGPCKRASPEYQQMSIDYDEKTVMFLKVNVDVATDVTTAMSVRSMPTFKLFKDGQELETITGWDKARVATLLNENGANLLSAEEKEEIVKQATVAAASAAETKKDHADQSVSGSYKKLFPVDDFTICAEVTLGAGPSPNVQLAVTVNGFGAYSRLLPVDDTVEGFYVVDKPGATDRALFRHIVGYFYGRFGLLWGMDMFFFDFIQRPRAITILFNGSTHNFTPGGCPPPPLPDLK
ncbi:hypothetical protein FOZ61_002692 [Perkinsus olseni]|uniref:Thioredoxin domain-containing protein n=1 Tax=Perkinsus olseni TaxID=32597 RepID=A0A7J6LS65_PEROL|nr:hypothetical protein FOZ61_002692 [Perkinsus olseni]KAF4667520.1 hypothetical protein FOL46_002500 [Perkinsus olseni]